MSDDRRKYYNYGRNYNIKNQNLLESSYKLGNIPLPNEISVSSPPNIKELSDSTENENRSIDISEKTDDRHKSSNFLTNVIRKIELEDLILIALIVLFAMEGEIDEILIIALVYIFFVSFHDKLREA